MIRRMFSLVSVLVVMSFFAAISAQDIVILSDGTEIQSQIVDVQENDSIVHFKNWIDLEDSTEAVPFSQIYMLRYENGMERIITDVYHATEDEKRGTRVQLHRKKCHFSGYYALGGGFADIDGGFFYKALYFFEYFPSLYKRVFFALGGGLTGAMPSETYLPNGDDSYGSYFSIEPQCGWLYDKYYMRAGIKFDTLFIGDDSHTSFLFGASIAGGFKFKAFELGVILDTYFNNMYTNYDSRFTAIYLSAGLHF